MTKWITKLKLTSNQKSTLDKLQTKLLTHYKAIPIADRPDLQKAAIMWGLPVSNAAAMEWQALTKCLAVAIVLTQ